MPDLVSTSMRAVGGLLEGGHAVVEREADSVPLDITLDDARHFAVERGQHLIEHLDQRDVEAAMDEVLRRLEADEPAADHDGAGLGPHRLEPRVAVHAREERRAFLDPLADRPRVGHGPDLEDAGEVDAGQRRAHRGRSGRQHELVVGLGRHLAGRDIAQIDGLLFGRDRDRLAVRPHVDRELAAERVRSATSRLDSFSITPPTW